MNDHGVSSTSTAPPPPPPSGDVGGPAAGPSAEQRQIVSLARKVPAGLLFCGHRQERGQYVKDQSHLTADERGRCFEPERYSPEDWLLYFWQEAKESYLDSDDNQSKQHIAELFARAFDVKTHDGRKQCLVPKGRLAALPDSEVRRGLEAMLKVGFEYISLDAGNDHSPDMADFKLMVGARIKAQLYWRAESRRDFETLRRHGYTRQAVDVTQPADPNRKARKVEINCDQDWHPFSDPTISSRLWYRKASSDNCWYTAISVASDWRTAVCYPKIGQSPNLKILKPNEEPDAALRQKHPKLIGKVTLSDGRSILRLVTRSKVAMVVVTTPVFDTEAKQKASRPPGYDEKGVAGIKGEHVIAMIPFFRVHHGHDDEHGFSIAVDSDGIKKADNYLNTLTQVTGSRHTALEYNTQVWKEFRACRNARQLALRWDPSGWAEITPSPLGAGVTIKKIELDGVSKSF